MPEQYVVRSAFNSPSDEFDGSGKRPVVFDIYAPDRTTSILPDNLKMVLHVNPTSMQWTYAQHIERTQTLGGFVEAHWGTNPTEISMEAVTGGFVRLFTGLSNITGPTESSDKVNPKSMTPVSVGGTRRDTIAYDKFLDLLALFYNNGAVYDSNGNIAFQGNILMAYDGGSWWGWFTVFSVEETAEKPYQFALTFGFTVEKEKHRLRGVLVPEPQAQNDGGVPGRPPNVAVNPPPAPQPTGVDSGFRPSDALSIQGDTEFTGTSFVADLVEGTVPQAQPPRPPARRRGR